MKRVIFVAFFVFLTFNCISLDNVSLDFDKHNIEPKNIYPQKLYDAEVNPTDELRKYFEEVIKQRNDFKSSLSTCDLDKLIFNLIGSWYLTNEEGEKQDIYDNWGSGPVFHILQKNDTLYFRRQSTSSYLYSYSDFIYIFPSFNYGMVKQIIILNSKLYFYVLSGDKWILDPIHDGGKYFYEKEELKNIVIP